MEEKCEYCGDVQNQLKWGTICSKLPDMKMKLAYKLFCAFLLTAALVGALLIGMFVYAAHNFAEYVTLAKLEKLDVLEAQLIKAYSDSGGWEFLRRDHDLWRKFLIEAEMDMSLERPHSPHRSSTLAHIASRLTLFDESKKRVAGNAHPFTRHTVKTIEADNRVIGWLGVQRGSHLSDPLATAFLKRQSDFITLTGAAALILTALVTLFISRQILRPVKALTKGTEALISRQFQTRVAVRSADELGRLAADFNTMAHALEQYEIMRRQWISDISHELRTPLAVLRGEIEALLDEVREANTETLTSLHTEVIRLGRLVDDLHYLSLADSENLLQRRTVLDPIGVLRDTVKLFQQHLQEQGLRTDIAIEVTRAAKMEANADRLKQVFANILENALRYVDVPGIIHISVLCQGETLKIRFEDSGPGVPPESLERLFDRLYRVDRSRSREFGGSGLGLAICKQIVEAYGGRIGAENSPLGGLAIHIALPLI